MGIRKSFAVSEYYHIFNRGVEKRTIFKQQRDYVRFVEYLRFFNTEEPSRSIDFRKYKCKDRPCRLVEVVAYCLNPNHFHLILKEKKENGISTFLKKICTGYAMYFNKKYERSGILFQGRFKSAHIGSNDLLLYMSAYVNCNSEIHGIKDAENYKWCSFDEYLGKSKGICQRNIVSGQFASPQDYRKFCAEKVIGMKERKEMEK